MVVRAMLREETVAADLKTAEAFLRRVDLTLRTGDAINIAIAQRMRALLVTFDQKIATTARILAVPVAVA
jgi:hypothetical protein